jgi:hypothetical protein
MVKNRFFSRVTKTTNIKHNFFLFFNVVFMAKKLHGIFKVDKNNFKQHWTEVNLIGY